MLEKTYQPLTIPRLSWDKKSLRPTYVDVIAQPLEPGFGITLGNALRRVLLGGIEGSAVTSIIIEGVNNEFSPLTGVVEDTMQVALNIKGLVVSNMTGESGKMHLKVHGPATVTAADITADEHLEIVNKDHVIAQVAQDGELEVTFFVESGRGYRPAQWPIGQALQEDNRIYIDAMFSPVTNVTFDVEKTRVGKEIDYDKLQLGITTDGSESPIDMLNYAVSVLRTQFEHFLVTEEIPFNEISEIPVEEPVVKKEVAEDSPLKGVPIELLLKPIDELELSVRAHNCLVNSGIKRVIDLVNLSKDEGLKIKNFGRKSLNEVEEAMASFGLSFGMNLDEDEVRRLLES